MKTKTVTVTATRRISDGNYGTFGGEITIEAELEEGDKTKAVGAKLLAMAEAQLEEVIKTTQRLKAKTKKGE